MRLRESSLQDEGQEYTEQEVAISLLADLQQLQQQELSTLERDLQHKVCIALCSNVVHTCFIHVSYLFLTSIMESTRKKHLPDRAII